MSNQIAKIIAFDVKQIEQIAESMSDRRVASRLLTKFFERKMEFFIHPQYRTRWHKTPEGAIATGRFLSDFDISKERNGVHMFGQVRLSKSADRVLDFVLISKKDGPNPFLALSTAFLTSLKTTSGFIPSTGLQGIS